MYVECITDDKNDETANAKYLQNWELSYLECGFCSNSIISSIVQLANVPMFSFYQTYQH